MTKAQHTKLGLIIQREQIQDPCPSSPISKVALELETLGYIKEVSLPGRFGHYMSTDLGRAEYQLELDTFRILTRN